MNRFSTAAFAATALAALQIAVPAQAQDQPATHAPPAWDTLARCADMTDPNRELACYRAAMRDAGYRRNPEVAAAERRKSFGLNLPPVRLAKREDGANARGEARAPARAPGRAAHAPKEEEARITATITDVSYTPPLNQIQIVTSDGAVWRQDDTIPLNFTPKAGQTVEIRKTAFGGYFCRFDRNNAVRCVRKN